MRADTFPFILTLGLSRLGSTLAVPTGSQSDTLIRSSFTELPSVNISMMASTPVPKWLSDFTGLTEWPGADPPYIPLDFIDLKSLPNIPPRAPGVCPPDRSTCSFDCFKCISFDDAYTCPTLSQTFDDGPSPYTPKLLAGLNHKTTFFTIGMNVVRYPEIYNQIKNQGHLLGCHTWSHKFLPELNNEDIVAQLQWSIWAMNATGSHLPKWYRPPYGGVDDRVRQIARAFGMQAVLWDHDSFDWKMETSPPSRTADDIYSDVRRWKDSGVNGLILEHDAYLSTVNSGIEVSKIVGAGQMTVAQCVDSIDYINTFD
ncbi:hypothetical protein OGAPHI_006423 [Ogataea philodendri]|uniref:chitin deacetylase n=1 Tax=Ogataea philodendri TaxID=1378263 RepID=A0A9P8NXH0_9ASCO|nr:uncharacterized protein OGAPHI_006423 [Ogataea philodendri]KAH3661575.1 hypothetical protein OGAPHI_006423 [Ogataea philodendri]